MDAIVSNVTIYQCSVGCFIIVYLHLPMLLPITSSYYNMNKELIYMRMWYVNEWELESVNEHWRHHLWLWI